MQASLSAITTKNQLLTNNLAKANILPKSIANKASDDVSIGVLTPEKTQAIVNREIADKLKERFKEEGIELKGLNADDYTPEKVSERILGFVSGRILAGGDNEQQNKLLTQAREGIEKGFAEARDILDSLDVLNGKVKSDADSTYKLIQQGLDRLDQKINGQDEAPKDETEQAKNKNVQEASIENSYARSESTQVSITTADGDKILIDLFKEQSAQSEQYYRQNKEGSSYSQSQSFSASTGISYQVDGNLDKDEQKAIDDLLKNIAQVSNQFFSGDTQQAFKTATEMNFDSKELTRFSLNLSYQESRQTAISTYSSYQPNTLPQSEQANTQNGLKEISTFIKQLDQLFDNPIAKNNFADGTQGIADLLKGVNQLLESDDMKQLEKGSTELLDSLVAELKQLHSKPA